MADYKIAIAQTLVHEGGYQDNPNDHANWSGGKINEGELVGTKYGITALDMPGFTAEQMKNLSVADAENFYFRPEWWNPLYTQITSQIIADKLFDLGVLFGRGVAVAVMQETLKPIDPTQTVTSVFGPITLAHINAAGEVSLYRQYKAGMFTHALNVANENPREREFLAGWIRRINCSDTTPCEKHGAQ